MVQKGPHLELVDAGYGRGSDYPMLATAALPGLGALQDSHSHGRTRSGATRAGPSTASSALHLRALGPFLPLQGQPFWPFFPSIPYWPQPR